LTQNLLIDSRITAARSYLSRLGPSASFDAQNLTKSELERVHGLICRTTTRVDGALIDRAPALKFVATASAGHDHFDLDALHSRGIQWFSAPGCNMSSVADYTITAIARLTERVRISRKLRIGVVGHGHVGAEVVRRCVALGLDVQVCDPPVADRARDLGGFTGTDVVTAQEFQPLEVLLRDSDLLTVHVPLTDDGPHPTRGLIRAEDIMASSVKAVINTSRGGIVEALKSARLPSPPLQVIDVWECEPTPAPVLLRSETLVMATPHLAGYGAAAKWSASAQLIPKIAAFLKVPGPSVPTFTPPACPPLSIRYHARDGFPTLAGILVALLGLEDDDRALRATAGHPPAERAAAFHRLRTTRPYRVEFAHRTARIHAPASAAAATRSLTRALEACGVGEVTAAPWTPKPATTLEQ